MATTLFKTSQVAAWCGVDLKTIHNWVEKKRLKAGQTPGRHLRFRAEDVHKILVELGSDIPPEVTAALPPPEQSAA